ncbi:hypothetical protein DPM19_00520 [Actinomadura craniellae]|uniref:Uncharacterized protein n=1 Tax=Actinomadura craniellae TaxID=2231787 RepID=A0A365HC71_9ACTN|nr:hypothetical protein [Actinomadura craniellae]RAY16705.1 hypothetical protein DPM19_00520 [Actinomadura craniellae]
MTENGPPDCPRCGTEPLPVLYGLPGPEMFEAAERGEISLGGCEVYDDAPRWRCRGCGGEFGRLGDPR